MSIEQDIQEILDEVEELNGIPTGIVVTSATEPTQVEWEAAWVAAGNSLPITVGAELYWSDGTILRGMFMTVEDTFCLPIRWSKILDTWETPVADRLDADREIWVRWWEDNEHLIGIGTYSGDTGTFRVYVDGTVEHLTSYVAVISHPSAGKLVVDDSGTLKLYDIATDALGATIGTISWTPETLSPTSKITVTTEVPPVSSGWGFSQRVCWADEDSATNLDLYYADAEDVYYYEDGVGSSLLFSAPDEISSICFANDVFAVSYDVHYCAIFDDTGALIRNIGKSEMSIDGSANIHQPLYLTWLFRKNQDDGTFIDILQALDPKPPGISKRYSGQTLYQYGNHTWARYATYDTENDIYYGDLIDDDRITPLEELNGSIELPGEDSVEGVLDNAKNKEKWGASLFGGYKHAFSTITYCPDRSKLLLGWGGSFGGKFRDQDKFIQGWNVVNPKEESGRHGCIVLAEGSEPSTGKVYRVMDYSEPEPTEVTLGEHTSVDYATVMTLDLTDVIANLDPAYNTLKLHMWGWTTPTGNSYNYLSFNGDLTPANYRSKVWYSAGAALGGQYDATPTIPGIYIIGIQGAYGGVTTVTIPDFRSIVRHTVLHWKGGRLSSYTAGSALFGFGAAAWIKDKTEIISSVTVTRPGGTTFANGSRLIVTAVRTQGKYLQEGRQNDYRMA